MKALVYHGTKDVSVDSVPDAKIEKPTDVVVKITTTNICGSDLHMYEGRTNVGKGTVLGHENLGRVEEVGNAVDTVKKLATTFVFHSTLGVASARTVSED